MRAGAAARAGTVALLLAVAAPAAGQTGPSPADALLGALKDAQTEQQAAALEARIEQAWSRAASPAVRLLLERGGRELSEHAPGDAFDSFDAALDLEPNLLEAWRGRASARLALGDYGGAVRDAEQLLRLEPRDFLAFKLLSQTASARGDWRGALLAWKQVLLLSPQTPGGQSRLRDLTRRAEGEQL